MEAPLLRWVVLRGPAKLERNALNLRAEGLNLSSWAFFPPNLILNPGKHAKDKTLNLGAYLVSCSLMNLYMASSTVSALLLGRVYTTQYPDQESCNTMAYTCPSTDSGNGPQRSVAMR